jgi:drug/metabolite transporter (DMT)-like permease
MLLSFSSVMPAPPQLSSAIYALGAVCAWGISDFLGGYTARRFNAFLLTAIGHASGLAMVVTFARANHLAFPSTHSLAWALMAGASGGSALSLFYRALSQGNMGLAAPVATVIGAAIPAIFSIWTQGLPHPLAIAGFGLALVGIWLISRPEDSKKPKGLGLAFISGIGFAGFYICMRQAGSGAAPWLAAASRSASLIVTLAIVLLSKNFRPVFPAGFAVGALAGCLDVTGTIMFVRASQTGRLDTAVVLTSLYPVITVLLARVFLKEHFTRWKTAGMAAALAAVPMIARG